MISLSDAQHQGAEGHVYMMFTDQNTYVRILHNEQSSIRNVAKLQIHEGPLETSSTVQTNIPYTLTSDIG